MDTVTACAYDSGMKRDLVTRTRRSVRAIVWAVMIWASLAGMGAAPAWAAAPRLLGTYGYWKAFVTPGGEDRVCYMSIAVSGPKADKKTKSKRGDVVLMVTHRPGENSEDVISYTAGMAFKPSSEVTLAIGKKTFSLFTQGDTAWARDAATDHAVAAALLHTDSLTVTGTGRKNEKIADLIHVKGAAEAYVATRKACGLPIPEGLVATKTSAAKGKKR